MAARRRVGYSPPAMMNHDCAACGAAESVEYVYAIRYVYDPPTHFECTECGARFEIEEEGDFDGETFHDCSTPGALISDPRTLRGRLV